MRRLPVSRRALLAAAVSAAAGLPVLALPSAAWAESPNPSACRSLYRGNPPGSLAITTVPPAGTVLRPGDEVEVTATWDTADWPRPVLHKVLDCLLIDGQIDYQNSSQEKPTDNDGLYRYRFTVRQGVRERICDRVRLSGRLVDGGPLVVQKSNTICFSVAEAGPAGPPARPAVVTTPAATPSDEGRPAPLQPAGPAAETPAPTPTPEPPVASPSLELSSAVLPAMLPRTGADTLPLVRLGGLLVLLGTATLATRAALSRQGLRRPQPA